MRHALFVTATLLLAFSVLADDEATHAVAASASSAHVRRVVIDLPAGSVTIQNGPPGRITVDGEVRRSFRGSSNHASEQRIADDIDAEVVIDGDEAIVRRKFGPAARNWNARSFHTSVELTVTIPAGLDVDVSTHYGEVHLDGTFGRIDTNLTAGEVHVRTPRASVHDLHASVMIGEVHTYFGDHYIENEGVLPRVAHFHNERGRSDVSLHSTFGEVHVTLTQ